MGLWPLLTFGHQATRWILCSRSRTAKRDRGEEEQPGPFKSPRPAEQCAPLPTPRSGGSPAPYGALSLLSVRRRMPREAHARSASISPGPPGAGDGAGRSRVCAAAGGWPFKNCPRRQRNVTNPTFDSQHSKRRGRAPGGRGARGGAPGGSGKQ